MKRLSTGILMIIALAFLFPSISFAQVVINEYEKAGTMKKGSVELTGNFTASSFASGGTIIGTTNNFGFKIGYGLSDKVDIKFRYGGVIPSGRSGNYLNGETNFSFIPKFTLVPDKFSLLMPISIVYYKSGYGSNRNRYEYSSIVPQLIYTFANTKNKTDFSISAKTNYVFFSDVSSGSFLLGATVGAGFSSDLSKWAIRPEVGILKPLSNGGGGALLNYGIALQFFLLNRKNRLAGNK